MQQASYLEGGGVNQKSYDDDDDDDDDDDEMKINLTLKKSNILYIS